MDVSLRATLMLIAFNMKRQLSFTNDDELMPFVSMWIIVDVSSVVISEWHMIMYINDRGMTYYLL